MGTTGVVGRAMARAPLTRRAGLEFLYALINLPLALIWASGCFVSLYLGVILGLTILGLPLFAGLLRGLRSTGVINRGVARGLLGERVAPPAPFRPGPGLWNYIKGALTDKVAWRAGAYLLLKPLVATLGLVGVGFWVYGLYGLTYPVWRPALPVTLDDAGRPHRGIEVFAHDSYLDTWPRILATAAAGLVLVLAAPWVVRGLVAVDRVLIRALLGPTSLSDRVRDLEDRRAQAVDDATERLRRIERDLHDGAQARLVALGMNLTMARESLANEPDPAAVERARTLIDAARDGAVEAVAELRDLARGIHPPVLDQGLDTALASLVTGGPVPVELRVDLPERPSPSIEAIAYFCAAELLTNVARHSRATRAEVAVRGRDGRVRLTVTDNGIGGARAGDRGSGLAGLAERVRTVDGTLDVASPPGGPSVVTVELPAHA